MSRFEKVDRIPPYILSIVNELKLEARRAGRDVVDLGFGNPDLPTADYIVEKLVEAARDGRNHRYSSSRGLPNLRRWLDVMKERPACRKGCEVPFVIKSLVEDKEAAGKFAENARKSLHT